MVDVDVGKVIKVLQDIVRRVVQHVAAAVAADAVQEHLEADAIVQVFAGVNLIAQVHTHGIGMIQDRPPARRQFVEGRFHQPGGPLRPGIDVRPGQRARKGGMGRQAKIARCGQRHLDLIYRPGLPRLWVAAHRWGGKTVEGLVIGGVNGHQLPLQVGRQFCDRDAVGGGNALDLVTVIL